MKKLIILSAVPGSGKSTWAKRYQETHPNTYIISSDQIRFELTGVYQDFSRQKEVWEIFENRIKEYAKLDGDVTVILDALIDLDILRKKYVETTPEYDEHELVLIYRSFEDIKKFNRQRPKEKWVPDEALIALFEKFELPKKEIIDLFDKYTYIDTLF